MKMTCVKFNKKLTIDKIIFIYYGRHLTKLSLFIMIDFRFLIFCICKYKSSYILINFAYIVLYFYINNLLILNILFLKIFLLEVLFIT